jgi:hypothetical protein
MQTLSRRRHCEAPIGDEAIQGRAKEDWIASSQGLLAMTLVGEATDHSDFTAQ